RVEGLLACAAGEEHRGEVDAGRGEHPKRLDGKGPQVQRRDLEIRDERREQGRLTLARGSAGSRRAASAPRSAAVPPASRPAPRRGGCVAPALWRAPAP